VRTPKYYIFSFVTIQNNYLQLRHLIFIVKEPNCMKKKIEQLEGNHILTKDQRNSYY